MRFAVVGLFVLLAAIAISFALKQRRHTRSLTPGEREIQQLVHEVYGQYLVTEQIVPRGDHDVAMSIALNDHEIDDMQINLSSLARHHQDGASLESIKGGLRFDKYGPKK